MKMIVSVNRVTANALQFILIEDLVQKDEIVEREIKKKKTSKTVKIFFPI